MDILADAFTTDSILRDIESSFWNHENPAAIRIRNAILVANNSLEGYVNLCIARYYFGKNNNQANHFWINILSSMEFSQKISVLETTKTVDAKIIKILRKINDIRNDVAHYPHRIHKRKAHHLCYNNKKILEDLEALKKFYSDFNEATTELTKYTKNFRS